MVAPSCRFVSSYPFQTSLQSSRGAGRREGSGWCLSPCKLFCQLPSSLLSHLQCSTFCTALSGKARIVIYASFSDQIRAKQNNTHERAVSQRSFDTINLLYAHLDARSHTGQKRPLRHASQTSISLCHRSQTVQSFFYTSTGREIRSLERLEKRKLKLDRRSFTHSQPCPFPRVCYPSCWQQPLSERRRLNP